MMLAISFSLISIPFIFEPGTQAIKKSPVLTFFAVVWIVLFLSLNLILQIVNLSELGFFSTLKTCPNLIFSFLLNLFTDSTSKPMELIASIIWSNEMFCFKLANCLSLFSEKNMLSP